MARTGAASSPTRPLFQVPPPSRVTDLCNSPRIRVRDFPDWWISDNPIQSILGLSLFQGSVANLLQLIGAMLAAEPAPNPQFPLILFPRGRAGGGGRGNGVQLSPSVACQWSIGKHRRQQRLHEPVHTARATVRVRVAGARTRNCAPPGPPAVRVPFPERAGHPRPARRPLGAGPGHTVRPMAPSSLFFGVFEQNRGNGSISVMIEPPPPAGVPPLPRASRPS